MSKLSAYLSEGEIPEDIVQLQDRMMTEIVSDEVLHDRIMRDFRFKGDSEAGELSGAATDRLDDMYSAVFDMLNVLVGDDVNLEWDMSLIGPVTEHAVKTLKDAGFACPYPGFITNDDGTVEYEE